MSDHDREPLDIAVIQDNQSLIDFVNAQPLTNTVVCLGDGHDGIWNLVY